MIQKVFGVRDGKAMAFLQPFFSASVGAAVRAFSDAVNEDGKSPLTKHPEDYILYELATFDDNSGEFFSTVPIKMLGAGVDFVQIKPVMLRGSVPDVEKVLANPLATVQELNGDRNA